MLNYLQFLYYLIMFKYQIIIFFFTQIVHNKYFRTIFINKIAPTIKNPRSATVSHCLLLK